MKRLKAEDIKRGMLVEERMANGTWARARVVAVMKRKTQSYPHGRVVLDVLRDGGGVECRDEVGLHEVGKYLRPSAESTIPKVDLLNASPHAFCETLALAAKIGVTDAMTKAEPRGDHALAELLCEPQRYRYEHVRMLHEAYESGLMFMELRGQPTNMTWGTTTDTGWQETEHGRVRVKLTKGKRG